MSDAPIRTVVFGAGRRVRGAVLPALQCLEPRFVVDAVVSRQPREFVVGDRAITTRRLVDVELARADLVVVAVATTQVPALLAELAQRAPRAILVLDTPVVPPLRVAAIRHARAFRRVVVAEDTLALPPFVLARRLLEAGAIGRLRRIYFFHNGFKYHALASIKYLAGAAITRITSRRYAGKLCQKAIELAGGVTAVLYEPRDYAIGRFRLDGDAGTIADYDVPGCRRIGYSIAGTGERGVYRGLTLDGVAIPPDPLDLAYLARIDDRVHDASPMNTMKLRGLLDILEAAVVDDSPLHYGVVEGITDNLAIELADRTGFAPPAILERMLHRILAM